MLNDKCLPAVRFDHCFLAFICYLMPGFWYFCFVIWLLIFDIYLFFGICFLMLVFGIYLLFHSCNADSCQYTESGKR